MDPLRPTDAAAADIPRSDHGGTTAGRCHRMGLAAPLFLCAAMAVGCTGVIMDTSEEMPTEDLDGVVVDPTNPGAAAPDGLISPQRRLSVTEYRNTVRGLFAPIALPTPELPPDEEHGGFATQSTKHVAAPDFEQYLEAAQDIGRAVAAERDILLEQGCSLSDGDDACVEAFIERFGRRAYRRRLETSEAAELLTSYQRARDARDAEVAFSLLVMRLLVSPHFLYKVEVSESAGPSEHVIALSAYELASRLSFFLWQSAPDDALLDAAESGALDSAAGVEEHARRMLLDERAHASIWSFHRQWLDLDSVRGVSRADPSFDDAMRASILRESEAFTNHVVFDEGVPFADLFTADYTFIDDRAASLYGMEARGFDEAVPYPAGSSRSGVFGHASFLAHHQNETEDAMLIHRGLALLRNITCVTFPSPPPGATDEVGADRATDRQCAGCHNRIDPAGGFFGQFGHMGEDRPDGSSGGDLLSARDDVDGRYASVRELGEALAGSDTVRACYATNVLRFALGREDGTLDEASVTAAVAAFETNSVQDLLIAIISTEAFRTRRSAMDPGACE